MEEELARRRDSLLRLLFRDYYSKAQLSVPSDFASREFAAQLWGSTSYVRHLAFRSMSEIRSYLLSKAPRHFYYSSARYRYPAAPDMDAKEWIASDLVFDVDADHLPQCSEGVIEVEGLDGKATLFTDEGRCFEAAKWEVVKLVDALRYELGFPSSSILVEFSGHRGFHVTVSLPDNDPWATSSGDARRELVNYLKASGLAEWRLYPASMLASESSRGRRRRRRPRDIVPTVHMPGVRGRLARLAARILGSSPESRILYSKELLPLEEAGRRYPRLVEALEKARSELEVRIDEQVTVDVKRLIRAPGSLHGKTGLPVERVDSSRLEEYQLSIDRSPWRDKGRIEVVALADTPAVSILGVRVKLRRGARFRFEAPVAVYLMAKGVAAPVASRVGGERSKAHHKSG